MKSKRFNKLIVLIISIVAVIFLTYYFFRPFNDGASGDLTSLPGIARALTETQEMIENGEYEGGLKRSKEILNANPDSIEALMLAGECAFRLNRYEEALEYFDRVPPDNPLLYLDARAISGELLVQLGRLSEAEARLIEVLALEQSHVRARRLLAYLLSITGRRWEAYPHYVDLVSTDSAGVADLLYMIDMQSVIVNDELLEKALSKSPDEVVAHLGLAKNYMAARDFTAAKEHTDLVLELAPDQLEAHIVAGELLLESDRADQFLSWQSGLSQHAEQHPGIWLLYGKYQELIDNSQSAIRCYWEALRRAPNHLQAASRIATLLADDERPIQAEAFRKRAELLTELSQVVAVVSTTSRTIELEKQMASLLEELGRYPEAEAWRLAILQGMPTDPDSLAAVDRLRKVATQPIQMVADLDNPTITVDLSDLPLPSWEDAEEIIPESIDQ